MILTTLVIFMVGGWLLKRKGASAAGFVLILLGALQKAEDHVLSLCSVLRPFQILETFLHAPSKAVSLSFCGPESAGP